MHVGKHVQKVHKVSQTTKRCTVLYQYERLKYTILHVNTQIINGEGRNDIVTWTLTQRLARVSQKRVTRTLVLANGNRCLQRIKAGVMFEQNVGTIGAIKSIEILSVKKWCYVRKEKKNSRKERKTDCSN